MEEVTFSDFQNDERYKKLERTLKLASFKKRVRQEEDESWHLPMSPSMSSINVDASDVNTNIPDSRAFKIGSEIVSSSKNLRNIVLKKKDLKNNLQTISTSSIRDLNSTNGLQDHFMMPPPNCNFIPGSSKKVNSTPLANINRNAPVYLSKCASSDTDKQSLKLNNSASLQISPNKIAHDRIRMFTRWKVILNEQRQLIIQGIINGSKFARSKPIVRRIISTKVQSISNHIYHLEGNIVDNECELPDYVRGKFYNGFPDDWENVHQIWQLYIQQGSRLTFRWPTPLADSDDDIRSEVTDLTFASIENTSPPKSFANLQTNQNKQNFTVLNPNASKDNQYSYKDSKTNKLKDKLNVIVNSIKDQNCSEEFVSKVIDIFDCLHYVVSYGSSKENESNMEISTSMQSKSIVQEQKKHISNESIPSYNPIECEMDKCKNINIYHNKNTTSKDSSLNMRNHTKTNSRVYKDASDSESEIYTGIPKISTERILQQREILVKPHKRKTRSTKLSQRYCEAQGKNIQNSNNMYSNDSGVSIIGDQIEFSGMAKLTKSKVENNVNENVNLGQTVRGQSKGSNVSTKEISADKMLEHFVEKDSMSLHKLTRNASSSSDIDECDTGEINGTVENKNVVSETNFQNEASKKRNYNVANNQYQLLNKICKPVVISSEAVDTNKMYKEIKQAKTVNKNGKVSEKEVQPLVQKKSPIKVLNTIQNTDSDALIDNNREEHEGSKNLIQLNQIRICGEEQNKDDIKTEKLTGWTPVLIYNPVLCLTFEGKLLNDAGHVVKRRFRTDAVLRRISPKLVETITHKFYTLVGDLNNHKHVIPKQLVTQCRNGCPTRIDQFCKTWESLQNAGETDDDTENNIQNIRMSSKGRRIIPPLSYWTGERVSMKHNKSVYTPGSSHDSSVEYMSKSLNKNKSMNKTTNQENNSNKEQGSKEFKSPESTENTKGGVVKGRKKKKIAQELSDSSDAADIRSPPASKRQRFTANLQESYTAVCTTNSPRKLVNDLLLRIFDWIIKEIVVHCSFLQRKRCLENERTEWKARSNTEQITSPVKEMSTDQSISGNHYNVNYFCYRSKRCPNDTLSEDQESYVQ
ncbi:uncharacterized protein LOC117230046 isoform X1 [Megalopta genalis]|uniref:uncharacterized protein LOC117230046 isoform X1 n=1 Tax=Megalopta genalis TaxID=115081 RepID=UPI003FD4918C